MLSESQLILWLVCQFGVFFSSNAGNLSHTSCSSVSNMPVILNMYDLALNKWLTLVNWIQVTGNSVYFAGLYSGILTHITAFSIIVNSCTIGKLIKFVPVSIEQNVIVCLFASWRNGFPAFRDQSSSFDNRQREATPCWVDRQMFRFSWWRERSRGWVWLEMSHWG